MYKSIQIVFPRYFYVYYIHNIQYMWSYMIIRIIPYCCTSSVVCRWNFCTLQKTSSTGCSWNYRFGGLGSRWWIIFNKLPQEWPAKPGSQPEVPHNFTTLQPRNGHQAFCHVAWGSCSLVFKHQLLDCQSEEVPFLLGETWLKIPKTSWMVF